MKIIAKSGVRKYLAELTCDELNGLAGNQLGRPFGGYYNNEDCEIRIGTTFNIVKAFEQIHRNDRRRQEVESLKQALKVMMMGLEMVDPLIEEPKPEENTGVAG